MPKFILLLLLASPTASANFLDVVAACVGHILGSARPYDASPGPNEYTLDDFIHSNTNRQYSKAWRVMSEKQADLANTIAMHFVEGALPARQALTGAADELTDLMERYQLHRVYPHRLFGEIRRFQVSTTTILYSPFWLKSEWMVTATRPHTMELEWRIAAEIDHTENRNPRGMDPHEIAHNVALSTWGLRRTYYHRTTGEYVPTGIGFRTLKPSDEDLLYFLATAPGDVDRILDDVFARLDRMSRGEVVPTKREWVEALYGFLQAEEYACGNREIGVAAFAGFYRALFGHRLPYIITPEDDTDLLARGQSRFVEAYLSAL